jgi:HEPN domain-containing protein
MKKEADVWMKKAEKDLLAACINLRSGLYDVASFLSQQSAEKALKAVYISRFERLWKIHDLAKLGKEIDVPLKILEFCDSLNPIT